MSKKATIAIIALITLTPILAWAGVEDYALNKLGTIFYNTVLSKIIPNQDIPIWSGIATILTLTWMLGFKPARTLLGKGGGAILALILTGLAYPIIMSFLGSFSLIILIIVVILFRKSIWGIIRAGITAAFKGAIKLGKETAKKEDPHVAWSIISALVLSGICNGRLVSNAGNSYLPMILSSVGGLAFIGISAYKYRKTGALPWDKGEEEGTTPKKPKKEKKPKGEEGAITCTECEAEIPEDKKFCGECGAKVEEDAEGTITCTECEAEIPEDKKFCGECGAKVEQAALQTTTPCPVDGCNGLITEGGRYCNESGHDSQAQPSTPQHTPQAKPRDRYRRRR